MSPGQIFRTSQSDAFSREKVLHYENLATPTRGGDQTRPERESSTMGSRFAPILALSVLGCCACEHSSGAPTPGDGGLDQDPSCSLVKSGDAEGEVRLRTQQDVEALRNVWRVEGTLSITGDVVDLSPLACLRAVTGDLRVYDARNLVEVSGLENLTTVGGTLNVQPKCFGEGDDENCGPSVVERVVLAGLREAGNVIVRLNPALGEARFDALERVGDVRFVSLPALVSVQFASLARAAEVELRGAELLEEADFPSLATAGRIDVTVTGLASLTGFSALAELDVIYLYGNSGLVSLGGMKMETLGRLYLEANAALASLDGLNALTTVEESLWIRDNASLASLDGLENLARVGQLTIYDNPALPTCEATRLRDRIGAGNIGGPITIELNDDAASCQ